MSKVTVEINEENVLRALKHFNIESNKVISSKGLKIDDNLNPFSSNKLEKGLEGSLSEKDNSIEKKSTIVIDKNVLGTLKKAEEVYDKLTQFSTDLQKSLKQNEIILKELTNTREELSSANDLIKSLEGRLDIVEKTPVQRKSIVKNFQNKEGFEGKQAENPNLKTLSLSQNKQKILDTLLEKSNIPAIEGGFNLPVIPRYAQAVETLSFNNVLPADIIAELAKDGIQIVQ